MIGLQEIDLTEEEKTFSIDLRPFMNPSPYTVLHVRNLFFFFGCCLSNLVLSQDFVFAVGFFTENV